MRSLQVLQTQTLTAAAIIVQSSHHTLRAIIILETKRRAMIGNVTAASIMDARTTSVLRDGCGTPLQTAVWRIVKEADSNLASMLKINCNVIWKLTILLSDITCAHNTCRDFVLQVITCAQAVSQISQFTARRCQHFRRALYLENC